MKLHTANIQRSLLRNAVLLTGAPRSGTTLLGKLISTFEGLEYHFEPPTLYMIASAYAAGDLPLEVASNLLTVYLSEDLLLETIHGRTANLRPGDDSLILNRMSWPELNHRWQSVSNRGDAIDMAQARNLRLALKMPNIFDSLDLLRTTLPDMQLLVSVRNGVNVVRSIIKKRWLSRSSLERDLWPYSSVGGSVNTPYWVPDEYLDRWPGMSEETRACLMWTHHAESGLSAIQGQPGRLTHEVRYETLLTDPWTVVEGLAEIVSCRTTIHTRRWIESIQVPKSMLEGTMRDFAQQTDQDVLERFDRANALWGY